ncbi:hypothetical protein BH20ACT9_BH20ACT9_20860 [soil metagenome]
MVWHIVRFRFHADMPDTVRAAFERDLRRLVDGIEQLALLRVAPSLDEPDVLGLLTGFATLEDLETYRAHPRHRPVLERAGELCTEITRLDFVTDDVLEALPRTITA